MNSTNDMSIGVEKKGRDGRTVIIRLSGDMNTFDCVLNKIFKKLREEDEVSKVVLDLTKIKSIGGILGMCMTCKFYCVDLGGDLKIFGLSELIKEELEKYKVYKIIEHFTTEQEAIDSFE